MFYKQFSKITDSLNNEFIEKFDFWLATIPGNRQKNITISLISGKFDVPYSQAKLILEFCEKENILESYYLITCPNDECNAIIRSDVSLDELADIIGEKGYCHLCDKEYTISPENIFIAYKRIKKPNVSEKEIENKILKKMIASGESVNFSKADSLDDNRNLYKVYYNPDESAYNEMLEMKKHLDDNFKTTTAKGNALEKLVLHLFKQVKNVSGTNKLKTYTNQFDCTLKVPFKGHNFPAIFEYMSPYFIIECKNESKSPSNSYFHKLSNIMDGNEAELGIVVSRKSAGEEALLVARETYLAHKNTNKKRLLINLYDDDLVKIIDNKENLLEYLDWKILNLTTNAKNSEFDMFKLNENKNN